MGSSPRRSSGDLDLASFFFDFFFDSTFVVVDFGFMLVNPAAARHGRHGNELDFVLFELGFSPPLSLFLPLSLDLFSLCGGGAPPLLRLVSSPLCSSLLLATPFCCVRRTMGEEQGARAVCLAGSARTHGARPPRCGSLSLQEHSQLICVLIRA